MSIVKPRHACILPLVLLACSDPVEPARTSTTRSRTTSGSDALATAPPNADQAFVAAADAVEGFGGFFFDRDGTPTVYLKDPAIASAVDGQLRAMFLSNAAVGAANGGSHNHAIQYRAGNYDFKELNAFGTVAGRLLDRESSAVSLDVDEVNNRVTVAVNDAAAQRRLIDNIRAAGVPEDAFVVHLEERASPTVGPGDSLTTSFNPIPAGVTIRNSIGGCTLGASLNWNGRAGWLTAAHCTNKYGTLVPTSNFGQPTTGASALTSEVYDPAPWQAIGDCVLSRAFQGVDVCRYSDAAILQAVDSVARCVRCPRRNSRKGDHCSDNCGA